MQSLRYGIMVTASVAMMVLASCTNDDDFPGNVPPEIVSESICFGISSDNDVSARGHAADEAVWAVDTLVLRTDDLSDTLCAQVVVSDGFDSFEPDGRRAELSRGMPVTKDDFYNRFHVLAYWKTNGSLHDMFYINEDVTDKGGNLWSTETIYYWMEPQHSLQFYAWAPTDAVALTAPATPQSTRLTYTVPASVADQKDIVVAVTDEMPGDNNAVVPLSFNHICTGVRFVVGDRMQPGTIRSIALKGVKNTGTYDMATNVWTLGAQSADFSQQLNQTTTGAEADGTALTTPAGTLMMIPQTLPADATLTVVFHDDVTGEDRTLTASLAGRTWPQGKLTTYRIGISRQYNLNISAVETQDAHYVICNSEISIEGLPAGKSWTLTASASDGADVSVQLTSDVNEYVKQGFWTDKEMNNGTPTDISARGTNTIKGSGPGSFPITVFLPENVSDDQDRTVSLKLSVDGAPEKDALTYSFTQVHPLWNNGTGWEQIDDNLTGAYGFLYDATRVYVYNNSNTLAVVNNSMEVTTNLVNQYNASTYTKVERYTIAWLISYRFYVEIDYSKLNNLGSNAQSTDDGLKNTKELFKFGGAAITNTFEQALQQMRRVTDNNELAFRRRSSSDPTAVPKEKPGTFIDQEQVLTLVLKKNRYYLNRVKDSGTGMETNAPRILESDIKWYLPASGQFGSMPGNMNSSLFWSSTAAGNNAQAYSGGGTLVNRSEPMKIRVARNQD